MAKSCEKQKREREMKPAKETEKAEAEKIRKRKPSFFTTNGDTPITLLASSAWIFPLVKIELSIGSDSLARV